MERVISPVPSQGGVPSSSSSFYENAGRTPSFHENARRTPSSSSSFHENARRTPSSSSSSFHENARRTPSSSSSSFHKNAKRVPSSPSFHENARRMPSSGPSQMVPSKSFENIGIPPSSSYDHISSQQAPLPFSSSSSHTTPRTPSQYFESHQHDSTPPGFVVVYPGEEDSDPQNSSGFVSLLSPRRETSDDLGPMLGVDMYQEDKGEEGLVVEEEVVLRGKERESESEEEWRAVGIVKEKKSAKRKTRKRKKQKRRRELSDSYVVAPTCPHCLALDGAPLPPLPDDPPLAFVFDCLGKNSKKKEQSAIKQKHESKILALQMSENSSRTKRVLAHEAALSAMDKQHKKEIRQEVRAANERPACLASHHVIEKRLLGKELVGYKKEKVAMKKKVLKEEADKAKKELNAKVAGIKAQKRGDKAAAVKRENVEFKLRKKHLEEFLNHQTDQDVKFYSRSKEFQLEMNQMYARDDLQFDIQKNLAQQKRRKLQEKHRERRRQLQELQDDEEKGLSALFPLQERLLRERADLDLTFLLNHHEFEKDRLELEIQAKAKQERREFRRKWRSEETRITGEIKEMKKAGQKGKAEQEKKRFEKELEKRQFEFYLELEDKAKNRRERLISHQEKKMKEMRKKHRKGAKELRVYQELKRSYMERRFVREQRELLEELANEMRKRKERDASKDSKSREDQFERVKERIEKYQKEREEAREDRLEEVKQMLGAHLGDLEHPSGLSFVTEEVDFLLYSFYFFVFGFIALFFCVCCSHSPNPFPHRIEIVPILSYTKFSQNGRKKQKKR